MSYHYHTNYEYWIQFYLLDIEIKYYFQERERARERRVYHTFLKFRHLDSLICNVLSRYEHDMYSRLHLRMYPSLDLGSLPRKLLLQKNSRQDFIVSIFAFSREWSTVSVMRTLFVICKSIVLLLSEDKYANFTNSKMSLILITFNVNAIMDISLVMCF